MYPGRKEQDLPDPTRPLLRSRDRMIAGVCGGLAAWLGWDPTLVRILYVVVSIFSAGFPGLLVYIVAWIVMPEEPATSPPQQDSSI